MTQERFENIGWKRRMKVAKDEFAPYQYVYAVDFEKGELLVASGLSSYWVHFSEVVPVPSPETNTQ